MIISFEGKGAKDMLNSSGCMMCSTTDKLTCKVVLEN